MKYYQMCLMKISLQTCLFPLYRHHSLPPPLFSKEDKIRGSAEREEVKKPLKESILLLQTIKDLKQTVETLAAELETEVINEQ